MSGLYNEIFGMNPATLLIAPMLTEEDPRSFFPRFRDCYVDDGNIVIYTRVGGGNRFESHGDPEWDFGESKLYELPTFIETYDDDFDCTYGYYVFGVPGEWRDDFDAIMSGELGRVSEAYRQRIAKCFGFELGENTSSGAVDTEVLTRAPDWTAFFDSLMGGAE